MRDNRKDGKREVMPLTMLNRGSVIVTEPTHK